MKKNNWPHIGNDHIVEYLEKLVENKKDVGGSYIFNGPDNLGKTTVAKYFSKIMLCLDSESADPCGECSVCNFFSKESDFSHNDFHIIKPEKQKKNISIEQIRDFAKTLKMSSFSGIYKIGIIKHAEMMSEKAANALLKILEEPQKNVIIILVTSHIDLLPATIPSRATVLNFLPVKSEVIYDFLIESLGAKRSEANKFARISMGRPAIAVKFFEDKDFYDTYYNRARVFLDFLKTDINTRISLLSSLFEDKSKTQENERVVKRILEIWSNLVRDLILSKYSHNNLVQHSIFEGEIMEMQKRIELGQLIYLSKIINTAGEYLEANVNPRTVLEEVAVSV